MSQDEQRQDVETQQEPGEPAGAEPTVAPVDEESTVGTGTSIALGCIGATLLLIVFALIMLGLMALL